MRRRGRAGGWWRRQQQGRPSAALPAPRGHVSATSPPLRAFKVSGRRERKRERERGQAAVAAAPAPLPFPPLAPPLHLPPSSTPAPPQRLGPGRWRPPAREDAAVAGGQLLRAAGGAAPLRLVLRPAGAGLPALPGVRRRGLLLGGAALRGPAAPGAGQAEAALPGGARLPLGAAAGAVPHAGAGGQQLRRLGAQQRLGQLELGLHLLPLLRQHRPLHHG